jgi:16S rRNA processing protein RimM
MAEGTPERIALGRINGHFGVKGWVKIYSDTKPKEQIVSYEPLWLRLGKEWRSIRVLEGKAHGKTVIARLEGIESREQAEALIGAEIAIDRDQLVPAAEGEYYWIDLIGLQVESVDGEDLGVVKDLMETGANDVLVVRGERERLIPFVQGQFVKEVDLEAGKMTVDWDPEF